VLPANERSGLQELSAFLLVFLAGLIRWWPEVHSSCWTPDGTTYQAGIDLVLRGTSPYEHSVFPYPPPVAVLGAWATQLWGGDIFRTLFRYANLLGGSAAIWGSMAGTRFPSTIRLALGVIGISLLPAVVSGIHNDNLSLLASGTTIAGLLLWPGNPVLAGACLGFGIALKPIALPALVLLIAHRPTSSDLRNRLAGGAAILSAAALLAPAPGWFIEGLQHPHALGAADDWATAVMNVSLFRVASALGIKISPFLHLSMILVATFLFARLRSMNPTQVLAVGICCSFLSLPIVWKHTLLLLTPIPFLAFCSALCSLREKKAEGESASKKGMARLLLVTLCGLIVIHANAYGILTLADDRLNALGILIPIASLLYLTTFVFTEANVENIGFEKSTPRAIP